MQLTRFVAILAPCVLFGGGLNAQTPAEAINPGTPWPATDALGRAVPINLQPGPIKPNRCVGLFYFLWHDRLSQDLPNDLAKILWQEPDALRKPGSPLWAKPGPYYWGEPHYGYYNATDPWVLRRHAHLLADAGIDTVIFDTTNRATYREVYSKLCEVWTQVRKEGGRTPQICFMVNTKAGETAREIYRDLYATGRFKDLWFLWQGKPLLICDPKEATPELTAFFTLRKAHWPFTMINTHNAWHWEATYPQVFSYDHDPATPEQVNVSVAQNLRASDGKVTNMSEGDGRGRSYHAGKKDSLPGSVDQGLNFAEQWKRALELDPPFVMVTGWNEWIASKFSRPGQPIVFVDQYDQEYSRDIEPVKGMHQDNYYYQLVSNVRRYKGSPALPAASPPKSRPMTGAFNEWRDVRPEFADHSFDNDHRDFGRGARHYIDTSGRNDIQQAKVARDSAHVFFYAQTREALSPSDGANWMLLLIDADQNAKTGWEGYDFLLNRSIDGQESWLERNTGGWKWEKVAKVPLKVQGSELMLAVPRSILGTGDGDIALDFKWWDNPQRLGDIMDTYLSGDVAPDGRFNFRYTSSTAHGPAPPAPLPKP